MAEVVPEIVQVQVAGVDNFAYLDTLRRVGSNSTRTFVDDRALRIVRE